MRIVSFVFSVLLTLSLSALALAYVPHYIGRQRIYLQGHPATVLSDTAPVAAADSDPYQQRYYSESEGWTYYTLPSYSSAH